MKFTIEIDDARFAEVVALCRDDENPTMEAKMAIIEQLRRIDLQLSCGIPKDVPAAVTINSDPDFIRNTVISAYQACKRRKFKNPMVSAGACHLRMVYGTMESSIQAAMEIISSLDNTAKLEIGFPVETTQLECFEIESSGVEF